MSDYSVAIERLEKSKRDAKERYERELSELDRAIAALRGAAGMNGSHPPRRAPIRPGQYKGMKAAAAAQAYLNLRGQKDEWVPVDEVIEQLQAGHADLGQPDRQPRNVRISFTQNPDVFDYNKDTDRVRLR